MFYLQFNNVRERAWPIEEHAAGFYTSAEYGLLRKEIHKSTNFRKRGIKQWVPGFACET